MMSNHSMDLFDGFLNLIGAIGIFPALVRLFQNENQNFMEDTVKWMLFFLFAHLLVRAPFTAFQIHALGGITYALGIGFMFVAALHFERLLRRHFPLGFKLFLLSGCVFFSVDALIGRLGFHLDHLIPFGYFVVLVQLGVMAICLFRDRTELSKTENYNIDMSLISLIFLGPCFLSDVGSYGLVYVPKLGVCAGLTFTYISHYSPDLFARREHVALKILKTLFTAVGLTSVVMILTQSSDLIFAGKLLTLFYSLDLLFRIYFTVHLLDGQNEMHRFLEHMNSANKKSSLRFLQAMQSYYKHFDAKLLMKSEFPEKSYGEISDFMERSKKSVVSQYELDALLSEYKPSSGSKSRAVEDFEVLDKMKHLLQVQSQTHICKLGRDPGYFILFNCPFLSYNKIIEAQVDTLAQTVSLLNHESP